MCATVVWTGADATNHVNTNWSDGSNWSGGIPASGNSIYFFDQGAGGSQGVVDNIVDGNTTILFLEYGNTNGFHTTQINSGVKLVVSNSASASLVYVGTGTDNGVSQTSYSSVTGAGTLTVADTNSGSTFVVQQGSLSSGSHLATLDLSGLANFNLTAGELAVGAGTPGSGAFNWLDGTLYLAATNSVRVNGAAPAVDIGDASGNGGTSHVYLGRTNAIFADTMTVAHSKATATLAFNPALVGANPALTLNGNTNSRVSVLSVGDFSVQSTSGSTTTGTMDLTGGTANALVNTCYVGRGQSGSGGGSTTGTLRVGAGVFNVNTMNVGFMNVNTDVGTVTGTLAVTNGTLLVNSNLLLAYNAGAAATCNGTLAVTNGTVQANAIAAGGGTSKIVLNGGLLAVTNTLGSPGARLSSLTIDNSATLQFSVTNNLTNASVSALSSDNTGTINIAALPVILSYPTLFPLIYCPSGGANGIRFATGTLPGVTQGYISNDNSGVIWLVVTNGTTPPKTDLWTGAVNQNWDTNTLNWTNNGAAVDYAEGDLAVFTDSVQSGLVTLNGSSPHTPYSWTVSNNTLNYTFAGTNSIGGPAALIKAGTGTLTLSESNDAFTGGITVNGGTAILNEGVSTVSGGLTIAVGATAQIGSNNANGILPSGPIADNGALVFSQTITDAVSTAISGTGSLTQIGPGALQLSGSNSYSGDTYILKGSLALTGGGSISGSAGVVISNAAFDLSGLSGPVGLSEIATTNGAIKIDASSWPKALVTVAGLVLGGSSNQIDVSALPNFFYYPTNITLIQSGSAISGANVVLGSLPSGSPAYAGSVSEVNQTNIVLTLTSGPLAVVQASVTFSATNSGLPLNPAFCGLSYEKSMLTSSLFVSNDTSLVSMFGQIAPAVLRVGGNSVDTTCWGGLSNLTAITPAEVSAFAGFVKALPTNWHVIYGINMSVNNATNCAAEAAYAASVLGSSLLGFEIGNEPDLYYENGIRQSSFTFSQYLSQWQTLAAAITNAVPGWAITNNGSGWTLTGPAAAYNTSGYTVPFAEDEGGVASMATEHYYRGNGQSPSSTIAFLLTPDNSLPGTVTTIVSAANGSKFAQGFRMAECGSYYNGGAPNVSDAYGTALWALDFMSTIATNGGQGINFHGGGNSTGYTPIADNGTSVVQARPEFYALKMFSLYPAGGAIPTTVTLGSNINFTAYGVREANRGIATLLINKDTNNYAQVTVGLGSNATGATSILLTGTNLSSTNGYTLGGAPINPDGSWAGGFQPATPATNGQVTVLVPPISALLLDPVVPEGTNILLANDALNTSSWTAGTNWTDGQPPHAGANYFTSSNLLRTPTTGSAVTFAGDSLTLGPSVSGSSQMILKLNPPGGTYVINNCTNAGGIISAGISNGTNFLSGSNWVVSAPGGFSLLNDSTRCIVLTNLSLSGAAALSNGVAGGNGLGTIVYAGDATRFTGPVVTSAGTTLEAWSQTNLGGNPASFNAGQFVLDDGIFQPLASMALTNSNSGVMLDPGGGTFNVGSGVTLAIANPITGSGSLTNEGGGRLVLSGTNNYSGATVAEAGLLVVNGGLGASPVTVTSGAALGGSGTIEGAVTVQSGGAVDAGNTNGAGTLTVETLNLGDSASAPTSSRFSIAAGGLISATTLNFLGTNTIDILDSSLVVGTNTLMTYAGAIGGGGFSGIRLGALPTLPAGAAAWLRNTGSAVQLVVAPLAPPVLAGATYLGGGGFSLSFSGGNGQSYRVLASTNISTPLTNWLVLTNGVFGAGTVNFTDTAATGRQKFYRISSP
jgi:autotransporter-associated beta strand protein